MSHTRIKALTRACGYYMPDKGRACLAAPTKPGGRCSVHLSAPEATPEREQGPGLAGVLGRVLGAADRALYLELVMQGTASLEDQIGLCRLRIAELEARYAEGTIKRADYAGELRHYWKSLKGLTDTQAKLAEVAALKNGPALPLLPGVPDAFDPVLAGAPAPAPSPSAEDASTDTGEGE